MELGGGTFEEITKLHNGYAFLLVKTGPLGLAVVGSLFLVLLITAARRSVTARDVDSLAAARLMAGATWVLVLTTLVIGGLLNGASMVPVQFLLGCSIALLGRDGRG
jgi:O-antigen ligase